MFDLFRSRAKAVRILLIVLLSMVALSMVVTLIPGMGSSGGASDQVVAEIGKDVLSVNDVTKRIQMMNRSRPMPREMLEVLVPRIVDELIGERAMEYEARRLGFEVGPEDLQRGLRRLAPMLFQNGQFIGKEAYAAILQQQELTIPEFEANVRSQMLVSRLEDLAEQSVVVTPSEVDKEYARRNEKVKLEYISFSPSRFSSQVSVSSDEARNYYQSHKAQYQIGEKRSLALLVVDEAKIAQKIVEPEEALRKEYQARKEEYRTPDRVHVRHILLKTTGKSPAEVAQIKAKMEGILKQLKGGADFAELAKKESEDTGSASKGGDIGWIVKGQTVPNFESAAFSIAPKELSGIITTEYGFHVLQVLEKEQARVKPFEEVKAQLSAERHKQQVYDTMQRLADSAHDMAVKKTASVEQIARQLDIGLETADKVGAGDPVPEFGVSSDLQSVVSGLPVGGVTPVMQAGPTKLAVTVVTAVFPARPAEFSEVESQIRAAIGADKLKDFMERRLREALDKAKASGDLRKVAQETGGEFKTTQEFGRRGSVEGIGSAMSVGDAFEQPVGGVFVTAPIGENRLVCKVVAKVPADGSKLAEQRAGILNDLRSDKLQLRLALLKDSIRAALVKDGKIKIHQPVLNRLMESYRS